MNLLEALVAGAIMVVVHLAVQKQQVVQQRTRARQQTQVRQVLLQRQIQIKQEQVNRLTVQQTIVAASLGLVLVVARAVVHPHPKEAL